MSLSCDCETYDLSDVDLLWYYPDGYTTYPEGKRRSRCSSCQTLIGNPELCVEITRVRSTKGDIEDRIYGEGEAVPLASHYLCEECGDLYFNLTELGFCVNYDESMRELVKQYNEMRESL